MNWFSGKVLFSALKLAHVQVRWLSIYQVISNFKGKFMYRSVSKSKSYKYAFFGTCTKNPDYNTGYSPSGVSPTVQNNMKGQKTFEVFCLAKLQEK